MKAILIRIAEAVNTGNTLTIEDGEDVQVVSREIKGDHIVFGVRYIYEGELAQLHLMTVRRTDYLPVIVQARTVPSA